MALQKDNRYEAVKSLIESGRINNLRACFKIIPLSVVGIDAKMHYATLHRRIYRPELLTLGNIMVFASLFDVDAGIIVRLAAEDLRQTKQKKRKS